MDIQSRIKALQDAAKAAEKVARTSQNSEEKESKASDAIPVKLQARYLTEMRKLDKRNAAKNPAADSFWYDMTVLSLDFGLRNIEAREMQVSEVHFGERDEDGEMSDSYVLLNYSKQVKSFVTKYANKLISKDWILYGQKFLSDIAIEQGDEIRKYAADGAGDTETGDDKELVRIAIKLGVIDLYNQEKELHYWENEPVCKEAARRSPNRPKGRKIYISQYPESERILRKRVKLAKETGSDYLFPANSLPGNRAAAKGYDPITRQTVYRVIRTIRDKIADMSVKFKKILKETRLGLHSCRKAACQRVFRDTKDLLAASIFLGHGNGSGNIAVTQAYMDKSVARKKEVYEIAAKSKSHNSVYDEMEELILAEGV